MKVWQSNDIEKLLIQNGYSEYEAHRNRQVIDLLDGKLALVIVKHLENNKSEVKNAIT